MNKKLIDIKYVIVGFMLFSIFFIFLPKVDLYVSEIFWDESLGFFLAENPVFVLLYDLFSISSVPLATILLIYIVLSAMVFFLNPTLLGNFFVKFRKEALFLFLLLVLGAVVVEVFFKLVWGRARPRDILEFGGLLTYTPAWMLSGQCSSNCSFMSGHSSFGFYFMAIAWLKHQKIWLIPGVILGLALSLTRIVQGGHFLSDVLLPGFVVYILAHYLAKLLLNYK